MLHNIFFIKIYYINIVFYSILSNIKILYNYKMNLIYSILVMFFGSFIIQYFLMSYIMTNSIKDIRDSIGKIYISLIMAILMSILEIFMNDTYNMMFSFNYYIFFIIALLIIFILYKKQIGVNSKNYLKEMIEHHSMALLTSNEIVNKTKDEDVKKLANNIIETQTKEIKEMDLLLNK
jgi:hypothetical protein